MLFPNLELFTKAHTFPTAPMSTAVFCKSSLISCAVILGLIDINSAEMPAMHGVAMEVPVNDAYVPLKMGTVLTIDVPTIR